MGNDLIRRESALNALKIARGYCPCAYAEITKLPTVDAVPVRHGRWDNIPNTYMSVASKDGSYSGNATTCSVCHEVNPNAYKTNFCPNCGAKMDSEADNG